MKRGHGCPRFDARAGMDADASGGRGIGGSPPRTGAQRAQPASAAGREYAIGANTLELPA